MLVDEIFNVLREDCVVVDWVVGGVAVVARVLDGVSGGLGYEG